MPFTDKGIASLKAKTVRYEKAEPGRTGLRIRVSSRGTKTWTFVYRFGGRQVRLDFGTYPQVRVADAHKALAEARAKLQAGKDPGIEIAAAREAERSAETVAELIDEYVARHAANKKSGHQDKLLLHAEVLPTWRDLKAKDITRRDVIKLLDRLEDRGVPIQRNRVASAISRLFTFAIDRGIVEMTPAFRIRRLPEKSRDRFLSTEEINAIWNGLGTSGLQMSATVALATKFLIVVGQRRAEVAGMAWSEVDLAEKVWRLPAERAKNGREHLVPLPPLAMALLEAAQELRVRKKPVRAKRLGRPDYDETPSPWVWPSYHLDKPLNADAITRALNRNREALGLDVEGPDAARVHDFRRTFATWHGELGTPPEVLSALLNHAPTHITAAVYNRASLLEPRRRAMDVWNTWLERVIAGEKVAENVVRLERRR